MTYPQQGYAPQLQPAWQPPQPPAPPQMPPGAPQFAEPGQVPQAAPSAPLGFQDPTGGTIAPSARHLEGRTIVIVPKRVDESTSYQGQPRPTAFLDLYVLDGGDLVYGDSEDRANPRPPTHKCATPAYFQDVMIGNTMFVSEVRAKLGPDGRPTGLALGVVQRGTRGQRPYMLTKCEKDLDGNERPGGAHRRNLAQQVYQAHQAGQWQPPKAQPLAAAGAPAGYGVVNYAQAATPAQAAQMASQHLDQVVQSQYGWQPPQPPPAQQQPVAGPGMPPPPSWAHVPDQWALFTPDQQQAIWAQQSAAVAPPVTSQGAVPSASPPPATQSGPGW